MASQSNFDYVIIGAGSAGCILAARLSEDPATRVLVIEAGGPDRDPLIKIPLAWMKFVRDRLHDWKYDTEPEPNMAGRHFEITRGKVLGGSSSINAMAYVRGHAGDYDRWAGNGLPGWTYEDLLPRFKRTESWQGGGSELRGGGGPIQTRESTFRDPVIEAYLEAVQQAGYPLTPDYNGEQNEGFGRAQQTIRDGRRNSAADGYLRPALSRPNLTLEMNAQVTGIKMEGGRAVGVSYAGRGGAQENVSCDGEVILSGGAINSPQLLMLSGIGPEDALRAHGIEVQIDSPGVGENLSDHISTAVGFDRLDRGSFYHQMRLDRVMKDMPSAYLLGRGPATDFPGGIMGFVKTDPELKVPDLQYLFSAAPPNAHPWFPLIRPAWRDGFFCRAILLHPRSRGSVRLASADPLAKPLIRNNFLVEPSDLETLRKGVRLARHFSMQPALDPFRGAEVTPGAEVTGDDALDDHISRTSMTVYHPNGTCRMGPDDASVVDGTLRVRGADALRVVDASIMPDLVGGNTNAAVMVIAEKAADMILAGD